MPVLSVEDRVGLDPARRAEIEAAVGGFAVLTRLVRWGFESDPPRVISNIVAQDEYTHDVVVPWGDGLILVFDST